MAQPSGMSDKDLSALVDGLISEAVDYDTVLSLKRARANDFMDGKVDIPSEPGKSSVVSHDMADAVHMAMPALLRTFLASDRVVIYDPRRPVMDPKTGKDISAERAAQATDYVNYVVMSECDGYRMFHGGLYAGLVYGNGIIKHWWDDTPEHSVETCYDLSEQQFIELASDDDVEILEHTAKPDPTFTFAAAEPNPALIASVGNPAGPAVLPGAQPAGQLPAPQAGAGLPPMGGGGAQSGAAGNPLTGGFGAGPATGAADNQHQPMPGGPMGLQPGLSPMGGAPAEGPLAPPTMDMSMGGLMGQPPMLHDVKIRRITSHGRLKAMALPNEEFRIGRNATALTEQGCGGFCAHVYQDTRSNLVKQGFDKDKVYEAAVSTDSSSDDYEKTTRDDNYQQGDGNEGDESSRKVTVYECYVECDQDGDGIAEWLQVIMAGATGTRNILSTEPWEGDLPFTDLVPEPVPFTWAGLSMLDHTYDMQRIKTTLWRQGLNGIYARNNPQRTVLQGSVDANGMDQLSNQELGAVVTIKQQGAVQTLALDFDPAAAFSMMEYCDAVIEKRTGLSKSSMTPDQNALQNQSATAANIAQTAANTKVETFARNVAEVGMKRLFKCILKLICKHQDRKRTIRLRGEWVDMDPRYWDADMDVTINTGLGSGSRERDAAALQSVIMLQKEIAGQLMPLLGADNDVCGASQILHSAQKFVECTGLKGVEQFIGNLTPTDKQMILQKTQQQAPPPNPEMMKAQAKIQGDQAAAQAKMQADQAAQAHQAQLSQQKAAMDLQTLQKKAEMELQMAQQKAAADVQMAREKAAADLQLAREKAQQEMQLRREEMQMEFQLKREAMMAGMHTPNDTNIARPNV